MNEPPRSPPAMMPKGIRDLVGVTTGFAENYSHSFAFTGVWNLSVANVAWNGSATTTQGYTYAGSDQATQGPGGGLAGPQAAYAMVYDGAGNVSTRTAGATSEIFAYTAEGWLRSVARSAGNGEVLYYDPFGSLAYRRSGTSVWFYVGEHATVTGTTTCTSDPCAPTAGTVKVNVNVLLGGSRVASVRTSPGQTTDQAFAGVMYYHRDRQGSVIATTTTGGVLGVQYRYGPYGELDKTVGNEATAGSELGYTGGLRLSGGLIHLQARVYDPAYRRFLQADTVDPLRFTYTRGDPTNYVDPSGRAPNFYSSRSGSFLIINWVDDAGQTGQSVYDVNNYSDLQQIVGNVVSGPFSIASEQNGQSNFIQMPNWGVDLQGAYRNHGFSSSGLMMGSYMVMMAALSGMAGGRQAAWSAVGALSGIGGEYLGGNRNIWKAAAAGATTVFVAAALASFAPAAATGVGAYLVTLEVGFVAGAAGVAASEVVDGSAPTALQLVSGGLLGALGGALADGIGVTATMAGVGGTSIAISKALATTGPSMAGGVLSAQMSNQGLTPTIGICQVGVSTP